MLTLLTYCALFSFFLPVKTEDVPALQKINWLIAPLLAHTLGHAVEHPYKETVATVRHSSQLCKEEQELVALRKQKAANALEKFVGFSLKDLPLPSLALCGSGGGYRAMITFLGALMACQDSGLLDASTYLAGVSGSTWLMGSWYTHARDMYWLKDLLKKQLVDSIYQGASYTKLMELLAVKFFYKQQASLVDVWGALLAKVLLGDLGEKRHSTFLSQHKELLATGDYPFPIYTTILPLSRYDTRHFWVECTPFEVGSIEHASYIPTWALGRKFIAGASQDFAPEQTLGFLLGVCGSAFTISEEEFLDMYGDQLPSVLTQTLHFLTDHTPLGDIRISPAQINNPFHQIDNHELATKDEICLLDAGIDCNLPLAPLLRPERTIDIMIIIDASSDAADGKELTRAAQYAHAHGLPFPAIHFVSTGAPVYFFGGTGKEPLIIYLPLIRNPGYSDFDPQANSAAGGYCSTFNMRYKEHETEELAGLSYANMRDSIEQIKTAITQWISAHKS
jgi:phospholipase A2